MPTDRKSQKSKKVWAAPAAKPLDEAAWAAWVAKGHARDHRRIAATIKAIKWVSIAGFLVAAGLWSHLVPFEGAFRCVVTVGAIVAVSGALRARQYAVAAAFGTLALFYNPVAPVFSFSAEWQRVALLASVAPFIASLVWPSGMKARVGTK